MGVVNVTPDSFSGDGVLPDPGNIQDAIDQALRMEDEGADIIDVGGESTRPPGVYPDAKPVTTVAETARVVPVIAELKNRLSIPMSIDSRKAVVAAAAIEAGASLVNDVSMLGDPAMAATVADYDVAVVVSHIRQGGHRGGVLVDVLGDLELAIDTLCESGLERGKILIDPGIGFAKTAQQSIELLRSIGRLRSELASPVLVGTSRKSFIGAVTGEPVNNRKLGSAATVALAIQGGADIVRVHDVKDMASVTKMSDAIVRGWNG